MRRRDDLPAPCATSAPTARGVGVTCIEWTWNGQAARDRARAASAQRIRSVPLAAPRAACCTAWSPRHH